MIETCVINAVFDEDRGHAELADFVDVSLFVVEKQHLLEAVT